MQDLFTPAGFLRTSTIGRSCFFAKAVRAIYLGAMFPGDRMQLPCTTVSMNDMRAPTAHAHLLPTSWAMQRTSFNDVRSNEDNVPGI